MERITSLNRAKGILGNHFIGLEELASIQKDMGIHIPTNMKDALPEIEFSEELLASKKSEYILILGIPFFVDGSALTINKMREHFGWDPDISEPCFYNQDWYLNEVFACHPALENKWYFLRLKVFEELRGKSVHDIKDMNDIHLPSALLCTYTFFAYYLYTKKELLWKDDFIWCSDLDSNGDQIYVGRYSDSKGINKNGFNIHRHLRIKNHYSFIDTV